MAMDTILFNNITLGQLVPWIVALLVVLVLIRFYKALFAKKKVNLQHTVYFVCGNCQWEGHISKFGTRCPKCDTPTGDLDGGTA
jgi:Zn finger protein HypA/HybF involved in hydrogenase expression